jgi:HK97 family phage major capsid protein
MSSGRPPGPSETNCFANNPQANLSGLGTLEIKPETMRFVVCATRNVLEDSAVNLESWMLGKTQRAFRNLISDAIITGDGIGKPQGILHPSSSIPICDVSDLTPSGQFTWQDLVMLQYNVPAQWHGNGAFLMNAKTIALCLTMSDANGRPIMIPVPLGTPGTNVTPAAFSIAGTRVALASQMPDVAPGATPVAFGNWNEAYMVVNRRAVTMQHDPYSAGWCSLFKFEGRVGGAIICPNAARLMRIK